MCTKSGIRTIGIPHGMRRLLEEMAQEVLSKQPANIPLFLAEYLAGQVSLREDAFRASGGTCGIENFDNYGKPLMHSKNLAPGTATSKDLLHTTTQLLELIENTEAVDPRTGQPDPCIPELIQVTEKMLMALRIQIARGEKCGEDPLALEALRTSAEALEVSLVLLKDYKPRTGPECDKLMNRAAQPQDVAPGLASYKNITLSRSGLHLIGPDGRPVMLQRTRSGRIVTPEGYVVELDSNGRIIWPPIVQAAVTDIYRRANSKQCVPEEQSRMQMSPPPLERSRSQFVPASQSQLGQPCKEKESMSQIRLEPVRSSASVRSCQSKIDASVEGLKSGQFGSARQSQSLVAQQPYEEQGSFAQIRPDPVPSSASVQSCPSKPAPIEESRSRQCPSASQMQSQVGQSPMGKIPSAPFPSSASVCQSKTAPAEDVRSAQFPPSGQEQLQGQNRFNGQGSLAQIPSAPAPSTASTCQSKTATEDLRPRQFLPTAQSQLQHSQSLAGQSSMAQIRPGPTPSLASVKSCQTGTSSSAQPLQEPIINQPQSIAEKERVNQNQLELTPNTRAEELQRSAVSRGHDESNSMGQSNVQNQRGRAMDRPSGGDVSMFGHNAGPHFSLGERFEDWIEAVRDFMSNQIHVIRQLLTGQMSLADAQGEIILLSVSFIVGIVAGYLAANFFQGGSCGGTQFCSGSPTATPCSQFCASSFLPIPFMDEADILQILVDLGLYNPK